MKFSIIFAYLLAFALLGWSYYASNMEFVFYGATVLFVVLLLHWGDRVNDFANWTIWTFNLWLVLHILGGLYVIDGHVLYSHMLYPLIGAPYNVLKYDQVVHAYCYFAIALLLWQVLTNHSGYGGSRSVMVFFTVLAANGIGGLNEIVEFIATVSIESVNVGGYENTAIDIICNLIGAILAIPFFSLIKENHYIRQ